MTETTTLPPAASTTFLTPLNTLLLSLLALLIYLRNRSGPPTSPPASPPPTVFRSFTPTTLLPFNGLPSSSNPNQAVYLATHGNVFDVSSGRNFYGPGGPYENFAGRDASRGLAKGSFDEEMLTKDLEGPLDELKDLNGDEWDALKGWEEKFREKYLIVGRLVANEAA